MATLSIEQLLAVAAAAGFSGSDLATAVAVAMAESEGGDPQAYNPEWQAGAAQGKGSYGLWQIYITMHPEYSAAQLLDPSYNAAAAFAVYSQAGSSFRPWTTYKTGAYLQYLPAVNQVIAASQPAPAPDQVASSAPDSGDGTDDGGAGFTPGGGGTLAMFAVGAGLLWFLLRG